MSSGRDLKGVQLLENERSGIEAEKGPVGAAAAGRNAIQPTVFAHDEFILRIAAIIITKVMEHLDYSFFSIRRGQEAIDHPVAA